MEIEAALEAACPPEALFAWVSDLDRYPEWLDIVVRAHRLDADAWEVDLRGAIGPLARTKRLRMVRTTCEAPFRATFERDELDGREHSAWRLGAEVRATEDGAALAMTLRYDGRLWGPVLERVLGDEIDRARPRLRALAAADAG